MEAIAILRTFAKRIPVVRGLQHAPQYSIGSVTANRLGLQVMRTVGKYAVWRLRPRVVPKEIESYVRVLDRDGVVAIPEFLTAEQFRRVRAEFDRVQSELVFRPLPVYENLNQLARGRVHAASIPINAQFERFPCMRECLLADRRLLGMAGAMAHVRRTALPSASIDVYYLADEEAVDNDVETVLHADLHSPTVKAFFYLNDVDETTGPFIYAKGSAQLTLPRLSHEYDMSVRIAKLKRGDDDIPAHLLAVRGPNRRNMIRPEYRQAMNIVETPIVGRANTLIVANNMGFHRRGEFLSPKRRETILLNFRHLQRKFWS